MIVDTQSTTRWALRNYCESLGYEVAEADSAIEALAQAEKFHPEALVIDCHVSSDDVRQLIQQVRSVLSKLPAIMWVSFKTIEQAAHMTQIANGGVPLLEVEKWYLETVLRSNRGNVEKAAIVLGISRSSLYERIKRYGINYS